PPVFPTPVRTVSPSAFRRSATTLEVRTSSNASSGCAWRSRRTSTSSFRSDGEKRVATGLIFAPCGIASFALKELSTLDLALENLRIQDLELDAAILRHVERAGVGHQRLGFPVADRGELFAMEARVPGEQVLEHGLHAGFA